MQPVSGEKYQYGSIASSRNAIIDMLLSDIDILIKHADSVSGFPQQQQTAPINSALEGYNIINGAFSSGAVEHHCILSDFVIPHNRKAPLCPHGGSTVQKGTKFVPEKQTKFCFWPDEHSFGWEECQGNKLFFLRVFGIPQMVLRKCKENSPAVLQNYIFNLFS